MALITYEDKVAINENPQIADINKVTASDMNMIKNTVNSNYNETSNEIDKLSIVGKFIRLKKTASQNYLANNIHEVSWEDILFDNTNGVLVKNGNKIECASSTHTVIVSASLQMISSGNSRDNYIYIRHNGQPCANAFLTNGNPHLTITLELVEGDTVSIETYSNVSGSVSSAEEWTGFIVTLLN